MDHSKPQELRRLFDRVLDCPAGERDALLDRACVNDPDLRRRIETMVAMAEGETTPAAPSPAGIDAAPGREGAGTRIGPYKLLQQIGEGGFGVVFLAEQEAPVRRKVALKIIKLGMDTRQVVARFEQERQALAMMDHPNIAKVLDAGSTEAGRPYFVMELVRGVPITEYCDQNNLSTEARLELFIPVCHAVQHAHQKGVIHRDIKPSNILVTLHDGMPVPKVIDFGIAKATNARLTEKTLFTEHRQLIGTPAYMSPEQAEMSGLDIDTRSDIYSLGVLLYELLTGTTPFDTRELVEAGYGEIQRIIREVDPPRPSTRISTMGNAAARVAAHRGTEPKRLGAVIRGDLDWIVMKAMEKDRTRRYETASGLAGDVERHLRGEPVEAAPPSSAYRLRKLLRRRRGTVVAVAAVAATLLAGMIGTSIGMVRARSAAAAERQAREDEAAQRHRAEATTAFLQDMLASIDPEKAMGREVTVKDLLDEASRRLGSALTGEPAAEAALRHTLGETYNQLARYRESKEEFLRELEIRRRTEGTSDRERLAAQFGVGAAMVQLGEIDDALGLLKETAQRQAESFGAADPDTLQTRSLLGFATQLSGDEAGALLIYREVLPNQAAALGPGDKATLETMSSIADVLHDLGRLDEARQAAEDVIKAASATQGPDGPQALVGRSILVSVLNDLGRYQEAEPIARDVLAAKTRIYGPDHSSTLITDSVLASTLEHLDQFDEAIAILQRISDTAARTLGSEHSHTLSYLNSLARNHQLAGHLDEAERLFRQVLEARRRVSGNTATSTLAVMNNLGLLLLAQNRAADAEPVLREMAAGIEATMPEDHWMRGQASVNLGRSLVGEARYAEAEPLLLSGYAQLARTLPEGHERRRIAAEAVAEMYGRWGKPSLQEEWSRRE